jgi:hypothetical protein
MEAQEEVLGREGCCTSVLYVSGPAGRRHSPKPRISAQHQPLQAEKPQVTEPQAFQAADCVTSRVIADPPCSPDPRVLRLIQACSPSRASTLG